MFGVTGNSQMLSVTASSGAVAIPVGATHVRLVTFQTSVQLFVSFGAESPTVVIPSAGTPANGIAIAPNTPNVFALPRGAAFMAAIGSGAGPSALYFSFGTGDY